MELTAAICIIDTIDHSREMPRLDYIPLRSEHTKLRAIKDMAHDRTFTTKYTHRVYIMEIVIYDDPIGLFDRLNYYYENELPDYQSDED